MRTALVRLGNGLRRIASRLPPSEEAVWPGVRNDLFIAHQSVYEFASQFAHGARVLDAASGTGYGSNLLAQRGARSVLGIDVSERRVSYSRRRYRHDNLRFQVADCTRLSFPPNSFDFIVSSNTLEHIAQPETFLRAISACLSQSGVVLVTVPPVLSQADVAVHIANRFHVAPLSVRAWAELFASEGWFIDFFAQHSQRSLDFRSPYPSTAATTDFTFEPC